MTSTLPVRFWAKVSKNGPIHPEHGQCWEWIGSYRGGYGQISDGPRTLKANRVAFELQVGPIARDMCVCHHCDNRRCVRGDHLFLGTTQENTADRQRKGRQARGERCIPRTVYRGDDHWSRRMPDRTLAGEKHPQAKLTDALVADIIRRHAAGESKNGLAKTFGVSRLAVRLILSGKTWKHVPRVDAGELVVEAIAP